MNKKTRPLYMLPTRDTANIKRHTDTESKRCKKIFYENGNRKMLGSNTYIKLDFKKKELKQKL